MCSFEGGEDGANKDGADFSPERDDDGEVDEKTTDGSSAEREGRARGEIRDLCTPWRTFASS